LPVEKKESKDSQKKTSQVDLNKEAGEKLRISKVDDQLLEEKLKQLETLKENSKKEEEEEKQRSKKFEEDLLELRKVISD